MPSVPSSSLSFARAIIECSSRPSKCPNIQMLSAKKKGRKKSKLLLSAFLKIYIYNLYQGLRFFRTPLMRGACRIMCITRRYVRIVGRISLCIMFCRLCLHAHANTILRCCCFSLKNIISLNNFQVLRFRFQLLKCFC